MHKGGFVCPGFVDIHIHGGGGADVMDGTVDAVQTVCRTHARHGTTTIFPTTSTGSESQIHAMLDACNGCPRLLANRIRIANWRRASVWTLLCQGQSRLPQRIGVPVTHRCRISPLLQVAASSRLQPVPPSSLVRPHFIGMPRKAAVWSLAGIPTPAGPRWPRPSSRACDMSIIFGAR